MLQAALLSINSFYCDEERLKTILLDCETFLFVYKRKDKNRRLDTKIVH